MGRTQQEPVTSCPRESGGIRSAGHSDAEAISSFITGLSRQTQHLRFFACVSPPSAALLRGLCGTGNGADVLVATCGGSIIGHAMAADRSGADGTRLAHVGLVVADARQRRGVGSALMRALLGRAAARGASAVVMDVLPGNRRVLAMIRRQWPGARYEFTPDSVTVRASLPAPALAPGPALGAEREPARAPAPAPGCAPAPVWAPAPAPGRAPAPGPAPAPGRAPVSAPPVAAALTAGRRR